MVGGVWFDRQASARWSAVVSPTARFGISVCAGFELADIDGLIPGPDSDGEGASPAVQDNEEAILGVLQGRDDTAMVHLDEGLWRRSAGSSSGS